MKRVGSIATLAFYFLTCSAFATAAIDENARAHFALVLTGPSSVKVGDDIEIDLTLTNTSGSVIGAEFSAGKAEMTNKFDVHGPQGWKPMETAYGLAIHGKADPVLLLGPMSFTSLDIDTGSSMNESTLINRIYKMTTPGQYTIQVQNRLLDGFIVKSNVLTVTVVP